MTSFRPRSLPLLAASMLAGGMLAAPVLAQPLQLQPAKPAGSSATTTPANRPTPLPPIRPDGLGVARADGGTSVVTATAEPPVAAVRPARAQTRSAAPTSQAEAVEKLNAYFNGFAALQGDFIQFAADGRRFEGKIYVQRPGKMRFDYRPPVTMEVVADGTSVAIRDSKLATQDLYAIGQTPLKFLLKERMDLAKDSIVTGYSTKGDILSVRIEDRSTLGGTSKITLNYDLSANVLRQWVVIDPQGYETSVSLYNLDTQRQPDPKNFVINYQRVL